MFSLIFLLFLNIEKGDLYVVKFTASWCGPCQQMESQWKSKEVKEELKKFENLIIIDIDKNPKLVKKFKVESIPTILIIDSKYNIYKRHTGLLNLKEWLKTPTKKDGKPIDRAE